MRRNKAHGEDDAYGLQQAVIRKCNNLISFINNVTTKAAGTKLMAKMMQMACIKLSIENVIILISIINNVMTNEAGQSSWRK